MNPTLTRRELLQWLGGATAGVILSPAPFALIDDLTIATQTRMRRCAIPTGALDRFSTRCPGCPAGCDIDVLTVAGKPYLCVPAPGAERIGGCPVLPALHQLRRHRRLTSPHLGGRGEISPDQARSLVFEWIDASEETSSIACLDLGSRGRGTTPLSVLTESIDGAIQVSGPAPRAPLAGLARRLELEPGLELALDPSRIRRIVPVSPATRLDDPVLQRLASAVQEAAQQPGGPQSGTVVLTGRDGVGGRLDPQVEETVVEANLALGALAENGPIVVRRMLDTGARQTRNLDTIRDRSLSLLLVDASRAWQAIPWSRLRAKLIPGQGRLVVFTPWTDASLEYADLSLPTAAPLEIEEFTGGDDRHPELRLALTRVLESPEHTLVDPLQIARELDPNAPDPVEQTAKMLVRQSGGRLFDPAGQSTGDVPADAAALIEELRRGREWRGTQHAAVAVPKARRVSTAGFASATATDRDQIQLRIEAPIFAGAGAPLPPVLAKLSRESRLISPAGAVRAHPRTLSRLGVRNESTRTLHTNRGDFSGQLIADPSVERGALVVMMGFDPDGFCADYVRGSEPLGHIDVDPRNDLPREWILEEVV